MHIFEYSGITDSIPSDIVDNLSRIESLRALEPLRIQTYGKEMEVAKKQCIEDTVKASMSLENLEGDTVCIQNEGLHNAVLQYVFQDTIPKLNEADLIGIHRTVLNGATRRDSRFRIRDKGDSDDEHTRAIRPIPARDIEMCIEQMDRSYTMARDIGVQPLLLVPCMILDFLNIHPFPEGNWRMSRILMSSLLVSGGYGSLRITSPDKLISEHEEDYYEAVAESSSGWNSNDSDPFPFIRFVTDIVRECYELTDVRYPLDLGRKVKKGERIARIVEWSDDPVTKTEICRLLPDVSIRTADVALSDLISEGRIEKMGTYRDARYKMKPM